jgi:cytochrome P450
MRIAQSVDDVVGTVGLPAVVDRHPGHFRDHLHIVHRYFDPYDQVLDEDPYPVWKRLRDEAPLYYNERFDFFAISRYADVARALRDQQTYRLGHGITIESITDQPSEIPQLIMTDPPAHTRLRKLVSRAFTPRRVAEIERKITTLCEGYFDALVGRRSFDYVDDFAGLLLAGASGDPRIARLPRWSRP